MNPYVDEEDLLGFHVFSAELELITGNKRSTSVDEVALLELLQKLLLSVDHTDVQLVKQHQRRCEQTLVSLLSKGPCTEVRHLINVSLSKLYAVGDRLPLFSQVNALQGVLLSKDAFGRKISDNAKLGMLDCLTLLCWDHGIHLISSLLSFVSIGVKHAMKASAGSSIRISASKLVSAAITALSNDPRHAVSSQAEALKLAERNMKMVKCDEVRLAGLEIVQSVARARGAALWIQGGAPWEEIFRLTLQTLLDASSESVQSACGRTLGELIAAVKSPVLLEAIEKEPRENKKQSLQRLATRSFPDALSATFCEAAILNKKAVCVSIAKSWVAYVTALSVHCTPDENEIVRHSIEFISILSKLPTLQPELKTRDVADLSVEVGHGLATGEFPMAQACVLYALRTGSFRCLSESGQRKFVDRLGVLLASVVGNCVPAAVCSLEGVRVLLNLLGEVSPETASDLGITFMEKLVSNSAAVRSQAAAALGSLVRVDPACAATLITSCVEFLKNQVEQLTSLSARYGAMHPLPGNFLPNVPEVYSLPEDTVKKSQDSKIREAMHAVYGYASGLAALLVAASTTSLNVPSRLFNEAFTFARQLIMDPKSTVAKSWAIEMKAGYCILGALCVAMPLPLLKSKGDPLELWEPALGATAQALMMNRDLLKSGKEIDLALQLWWRCEGLLALEVYIQSAVQSSGNSTQRHECRRIAALLIPLLEGLTSNEDVQDPAQTVGGPGSWVSGTLGYLQLQLLNLFRLMPDSTALSSHYSVMTKLCSQPFSPTSSLLNSPTTATAIASVLLRSVLDNGDSHLGPWPLEEEPLEEKLNQMTGDKGAPHYAGWECGMSVWGVSVVSPSEIESRIDYEPIPFPQYTSLAVSLIKCQAGVFGKLLQRLPVKHKHQLIDSLIVCVQNVKTIKNPMLQQALLPCVCFAMLSEIDKSSQKQSTEAAKKVVELAMTIVDCGIKNPAVLRGAAEITAIAAQMADSTFALRLTKQLCSDLASTTLPDRQCFILLAIGCLFRSKGGMCLQTILPDVVTLLFNFIQKTTGDILLWALHSLYLTAVSGGLPFMPYVRRTLEMAEKLMTSPGDTAAIRPYLGRLTNAMVALLGPELLPESRNYMTCKCLMRQMKCEATATTSINTQEGISGALELVLYSQQLILFAPQAVSAKKHVSILMEALNMPHPSLRHTAAITLRHLTERDPQSICQECIEKPLFQALDAESEAHISHALRLTLEALQAAQCPTRPSVWLEVCSSIVMMNPREAAQRTKVLHKEGSLMQEEELEEGTEAAGNETSDTLPSLQETGRTPRLKTRLFACQCLLKIFEAVGSDPRHFDLIKARQYTGTQEFLVCHLQEIVRLGFSLSTGRVEALQPEGIKLLNAVILHFGDADDPDMDEAKLLFQYQAQFVSPLRQALAPVAPPLLFMSGSMLAVSFLRSGLGGSDSAVLKQLVGLLVDPIMNWSQLRYRNFSEWVSASVRVSLLEAHAHCTVLAEAGNDQLCSEIVESAQTPILEQLKYLWLGLLTDFMVLNRWQNELWSAYQPLVICIDKDTIHSAESFALEETWPVVLRALALHIPSAKDMPLEAATPRMDAAAIAGFQDTDPKPLPAAEDLSPAEMYSRLLDITTVHLGTSSMKVIEQAKSEDGLEHVSLDIEPIRICVGVLKRLLGSEYLSSSLCPPNVSLEVVEMIMSIVQQVIHPIVCSLSSDGWQVQQELLFVVLSASELLLGVATGMQESCIEHPNFVSVLFDCILGCSSILTPSPITQNAGTKNMMTGSENCMYSLEKIILATPWEITRNWMATVVQHAVIVLGQESISESVIASVSALLRAAVKKMVDNGGDVMNGHETMQSLDLSAWTACSVLDLSKKRSESLKSPTSPVPQEMKHFEQDKLYQCLMLLFALLSETAKGGKDAKCEALLSDVIGFVLQCLELSQLAELQTVVLKSLKAYLQDASGSEKSALSSLWIVEVGPSVAALAHEKIGVQTVASDDLVVIAECLKYFVVSLDVPEVSGKEGIIFQVLIPLLIESMECDGHLSLRQMSFKLVSHLNTGRHATSFKAAIASLPAELKQRFQKGLQIAVGTDAQKTEIAPTLHVEKQKPSIVLKNFSVQ